MVQLLQHKDIDKLKWDHLVAGHAASPIYNLSAYLDCMHPEWQALIIDEYRIGLVLPIKTKWGIQMVFTPPFIQKLSIIGPSSPSEQRELFQIVFQKFKLISLNLDHFLPNQLALKKTNLIIQLGGGYQAIQAQYSTLAIRSIKKSKANNLTIEANVSPTQVIDSFVTFYKDKIKYSAQHIAALKRFAANHPELIRTFAVKSQQEIIYQCLCLKDHKRIYYLISAPTKKGMDQKATYFCMDQIIQKYAEQSLILDFEGSEISDIAFYYTRFGAVVEPYYTYQQNNMPVGIKQIIRNKIGF